MTLGYSLGQGDMQSDVPPCYRHLVAKSSTKLESLMGSILAHWLFTCLRGKSYIAMQEI